MIKWAIKQFLKNYLNKEFTWNTIKKYYKYFEDWYENLTESQIEYYKCYMNGDKRPYVKK